MFYGLMIPVIKVRDNIGLEKTEHIVGTDSHDSLYVDDDGHIQYLNLQNGSGTLDAHDGYEFIGEEVNPDYSPYPVIEFISLEEAIKLDKKLEKQAKENLKELQKIFGKGAKIID